MAATTPMADRYLPRRGDAVTSEYSQYAVSKENNAAQVQEEIEKPEYKSSLEEALFAKNPSSAKILRFKPQAPLPPDDHVAKKLDSFFRSGEEASRTQRRVYPKVPEKILDAPEMSSDFYINPLDWSAKNVLAVGLSSSLYLWDAEGGDVSSLLETDKTNPIGCVSWNKTGEYLAVGTSADCKVMLVDPLTKKVLRRMDGHSDRVSAISWNGAICSSSGRDGKIVNHDVRLKNHIVQTLSGHEGDVCGLQWSPHGQLASGCNDNTVRIWDSATMQSVGTRPMHTLTDHVAAVKALDWCPFQRHLLATGGGAADKKICFWNASSGVCVNSIDADSQVCALRWSTHYRELVSAHGFARNNLTVWKYPSLVRSTELTGHRQRVLHLALSPDGETVVSASADETLRFWKLFQAPVGSSKKRTATASHKRALKCSQLR